MGSVSVSVLSLFLCAEQSVFISALHWVTLCSLSVTSHPQEALEVSGRKYLLRSLLSQKCGVTYGFFWRRTDFRFQASKAQTRKLRFANDKISVKWLMERKSDQLNVFLQLWHFSSFCVFLTVLGLLTYIFRDSLSLTLQATLFQRPSTQWDLSLHMGVFTKATQMKRPPSSPRLPPPFFLSLLPTPSLDWLNCTASSVCAAAYVGHTGTILGARPLQLGSGLPHMFDCCLWEGTTKENHCYPPELNSCFFFSEVCFLYLKHTFNKSLNMTLYV